MIDPIIKQLHARRLALGWSQVLVEKKINGGLTFGHNIHRWERGHNCPSLFMVRCWAQVLGLKLELEENKNAEHIQAASSFDGRCGSY